MMARRIEATALIERSPADIFAFLTVPANHPKFVPGMLEFKQTSPGSLVQVGARVRGVRRFMGRKMDLPYEITECQPDRSLGMSGAMGPIRFDDGYVLDPVGNGTHVRFWLEFRLTGLMRLARPLVALVGRTHASETLTNLKRAVETAG
jgi:uncharacterized protein YndB with AHSA1/START domain